MGLARETVGEFGLDRRDRAGELQKRVFYRGWDAPSFDRVNAVTKVSLAPKTQASKLGAFEFEFDSEVPDYPVFRFGFDGEEYGVYASPIQEHSCVGRVWVREGKERWHRVGGEESQAVRALACKLAYRLACSLPQREPETYEARRFVTGLKTFLKAHDRRSNADEFADDAAHVKWLEIVKGKLEKSRGLKVHASGLVEYAVGKENVVSFNPYGVGFTVFAFGGAPLGESLHNVFVEGEKEEARVVAKAWRGAAEKESRVLCGSEKHALLAVVEAFGEKVRRAKILAGGDLQRQAALDAALEAVESLLKTRGG